MIERNVIKFGYGTVLVSSSEWLRELRFQHIEPPLVIGESPKNEGDITIVSEITFNYDVDMRDLLKQLSSLESYGYRLSFRGHVLDFTKHNETSIEVVKKALKNVINGDTRLQAC